MIHHITMHILPLLVSSSVPWPQKPIKNQQRRNSLSKQILSQWCIDFTCRYMLHKNTVPSMSCKGWRLITSGSLKAIYLFVEGVTRILCFKDIIFLNSEIQFTEVGNSVINSRGVYNNWWLSLELFTPNWYLEGESRRLTIPCIATILSPSYIDVFIIFNLQ